MTGQTDQQPTHIRFCVRGSDSHRWTPVRIAMAANGVGDLRLRDVRWNAPSFPQITYEFALHPSLFLPSGDKLVMSA